MKIEKRACECCKRETLDYYNEIGWIEMGDVQYDGHIRIHISRGRQKDGPAKSGGYWGGRKEPLDFCGIDCLVKWLKALPH